MADEKQYLRAVLSEARSSLSAERAGVLSARVQRCLLATKAYLAAAKVVLYAPLGREVETALIAADALRSHRQLYYPIADRGHHRIRFGAVSDPGELRPGAFGILEPPATGAFEAEALAPDLDAALICVPGIAFTLAAARLGRGGGYYDRLLATLPAHAVTAGLGYSFQLLDRLPEQAHDRRLDLIVTESAVYAASDASVRGHASGGPGRFT
ncbi:MAG TPA: 5-formyltetrahydrofolate cyclo-ligase [Candidatus Binataceae bacterium]|nr:5-formyltetrahydrofolate cyclo-ligase [Candidatus Binataceae bacterium]